MEETQRTVADDYNSFNNLMIHVNPEPIEILEGVHEYTIDTDRAMMFNKNTSPS